MLCLINLMSYFYFILFLSFLLVFYFYVLSLFIILGPGPRTIWARRPKTDPNQQAQQQLGPTNYRAQWRRPRPAWLSLRPSQQPIMAWWPSYSKTQRMERAPAWPQRPTSFCLQIGPAFAWLSFNHACPQLFALHASYDGSTAQPLPCKSIFFSTGPCHPTTSSFFPAWRHPTPCILISPMPCSLHPSCGRQPFQPLSKVRLKLHASYTSRYRAL